VGGEPSERFLCQKLTFSILLALAAAYSFNFAGAWLVNFFTNYRTQFLNAKDDSFLDTLSDFHPTLSGLKSYWLAFQ
jgi:hypothetical protein